MLYNQWEQTNITYTAIYWFTHLPGSTLLMNNIQRYDSIQFPDALLQVTDTELV